MTSQCQSVVRSQPFPGSPTSMNAQRTKALDVLAGFLLVDRSFPPLLRDHPAGRAAVAEARAVERDLAAVIPGWRVQVFPRGLVTALSDQGATVYQCWLAAYLAGLDAGVRGVTALVEAEHQTHVDRWMLAYDLGDRLRSGT